MQDEPRIGLVAPLPPQIGGVASFAEWLLANEREIGCRYDTFDLWRHPEEEVGGRVRLSTVRRQTRLLARFVRWLPTAPRLTHYCVAWTPTGLARDLLFLTLLRLSRRRAIGNIHVVADVGRRRRFALRVLARLTTELVTTTRTAAESLAAAGAPAQWISNPLRIEPNGNHRSSNSSALRLLFVGRYGAAKGAPELVAALAGARTSGVEATLRFVGQELYAGDEASLRKEVRELGLGDSVEFAGVLPPERLRDCYEEADVICLPSHREGLPMALLEGMAFGLPVLASPVGGIPDLVTDGEDGLLVEPGNIDGLRVAIEALAASPDQRASMGSAARARVRAVTDPALVARRWRDVYARCTAR
jgi:glycosyltransferase involved in cell wall biosynthesis